MERPLNGSERTVSGKTFDRRDIGAFRLNGEQQATADGRAVEMYGARPADAMRAANVCTGEPQFMPQEVCQQHARLDRPLIRLAVNRKTDVNFCRHVFASSSKSFFSACRVSETNSSLRYSAVACRS